MKIVITFNFKNILTYFYMLQFLSNLVLSLHWVYADYYMWNDIVNNGNDIINNVCVRVLLILKGF